MARKNREASYINVIDGETVWERLRTVRSFLEDRELSLEMSKLQDIKISRMKKDSVEYMEAKILEKQRLTLRQECVEEIDFLKGFESKLSTEAEKTRISGKTDDEMYEINYYDEQITRLVNDAKAEIISTGRIEKVTIKALMRNRPALNVVISLGFLTEDVLKIAGPESNVLASIEYKKG